MKKYFNRETAIITRDGNFVLIQNPGSNLKVGRRLGFRNLSESELVDFIIKEQNFIIKEQNQEQAIIDSFKGQTPQQVQENPNFAYAKNKPYGIAIYAKVPSSPTGVVNAYGFDHNQKSFFNL